MVDGRGGREMVEKFVSGSLRTDWQSINTGDKEFLSSVDFNFFLNFF